MEKCSRLLQALDYHLTGSVLQNITEDQKLKIESKYNQIYIYIYTIE